MLLVMFALLFPPGTARAGVPGAVAGQLDLSQWDFNRRGTVKLDGQWLFVWGTRVPPDVLFKPESDTGRTCAQVPSSWKSYAGRLDGITSQGLATYGLRISLPDSPRFYTIYVPEAGTAYTLFVNGEKRVSVGRPGDSARTTTPQYAPASVNVTPRRGMLELVFWVSNHHHRDGGLWESILFGPMEHTNRMVMGRLATNLFLFGAILFMGIYHAALFHMRRKDRALLYFSAFCFLIAVRILVTGDRYLIQMIPGLPWWLMIKVEYLTFYLGGLIFSLYLHHLLPDYIKRLFIRLLLWMVIPLVILVVVSPARYFSHSLPFAQTISMLALCYFLFGLVSASLARQKGARTLIFGFVVFFITVIHDIMYASGYWESTFLVPFGLVIFILFQTLVLAGLYSTAFNTMEEQSVDLAEKNETINRELRQREEAEAALRDSERRYRNLAELLPEMVFETDSRGTILFANKAARKRLGLTDRNIEDGLDARTLVDDADMGLLNSYTLTVFAGGAGDPIEVTALDRNGVRFPMNVVLGRIIDDDGRARGLRGVATDVTERKKTEQRLRQSQKMEAVGNLAGGIAHEFNNKLAIILGNLRLAMDDLPRETEVQEYLDSAVQAARRSVNLVKQMLAFSRQDILQPSPTNDLAPVAVQQLNSLKTTLPSSIELRSDLPRGMGAAAIDAERLSQVIDILFTNAVQAMSGEGGVLEVKLEGATLDQKQTGRFIDLEPGKYLKLSVRDSGIGMSQEVLERVFEPFFSTRTPDQGTGMGLAVAQGIVRSHGGDIDVSSLPGRGTAVEVYLPLVEIGAGESESGNRALPVSGGAARVLLIDDEANLVKLSQRMLERLGYTVTGLTSSREALDRFRSAPHEFDLVITDQTMPEMTGDRLARDIIELRPGIPIILCTGLYDRTVADASGAIGYQAILNKPFEMKELAEAVRNALRPGVPHPAI